MALRISALLLRLPAVLIDDHHNATGRFTVNNEDSSNSGTFKIYISYNRLIHGDPPLIMAPSLAAQHTPVE